MRVMGIDPGSNCTGYGLIEAGGGRLRALVWGGIRNKPSQPFPERLQHIYAELTRIISDQKPDAVAVEDLFFAENAKSALKLGQTRGVVLLAAAHSGKTIAEYTPLQVKQAVTSYGRADKEQVRRMVMTLLSLKETPEPYDAADALAVAICHAHAGSTRLRAASARASS